MDNIIQWLKAQYDIDKLGETSTTAFKLHEVLISLATRTN